MPSDTFNSNYWGEKSKSNQINIEESTFSCQIRPWSGKGWIREPNKPKSLVNIAVLGSFLTHTGGDGNNTCWLQQQQ